MSTNRMRGVEPATDRLTRRALVRRAGVAGMSVAAAGSLRAKRPGAAGAQGGAARPLAAPLEHLEELQSLRTTGLVKAMRAAPFTARNVEATIVALARAGVGTYEGPGSAEPVLPVDGEPSPVRLLSWQARNLALEVSTQSGQLGADLDALAPSADRMPGCLPPPNGWPPTRPPPPQPAVSWPRS
jgi:hypothetical protein